MKGRNPTAAQRAFWDLLASLGCPACLQDHGCRNTHVSIHHIDGRTKPNAHWLVLPLCAGHHQDGYGAPGMTAIHPYKGRWERQYGRQRDLLASMARELIDAGHNLPQEVRDLADGLMR